jgi:hypothetical protein
VTGNYTDRTGTEESSHLARQRQVDDRDRNWGQELGLGQVRGHELGQEVRGDV